MFGKRTKISWFRSKRRIEIYYSKWSNKCN